MGRRSDEVHFEGETSRFRRLQAPDLNPRCRRILATGQGIRSRVSAPDLDIQRYPYGNQTRLSFPGIRVPLQFLEASNPGPTMIGAPSFSDNQGNPPRPRGAVFLSPQESPFQVSWVSVDACSDFIKKSGSASTPSEVSTKSRGTSYPSLCTRGRRPFAALSRGSRGKRGKPAIRYSERQPDARPSEFRG
jgi:hypothetical protein